MMGGDVNQEFHACTLRREKRKLKAFLTFKQNQNLLNKLQTVENSRMNINKPESENRTSTTHDVKIFDKKSLKNI
jgi:hypothetical protein